MNEEKERETPIAIPSESLSEEALAGIIENFIQREGTDYGVTEASYETKSSQIRKQIARGDIKIVFDKVSESVSLLTARDFNRLLKSAPM
jgi:uncharacterized protein YheU (UPF0270 family)